MSTRIRWVAALAIVFASATAQATTITFGDSKDTTIYKSQADRGNSLGLAMYAGQDPGGASTSKRALVAFDIASHVPSGATIQSVQLSLTFSAAADSGGTPGNGDSTPRQIDLLRMTDTWAEGTSGSGMGFTASAGEATWNNEINPSTAWATAGGGGDFVGAVSASTVVGNPNTNALFNWRSTANMVADVQLWLNNPSQNFGWILKADDETTTQSFRAFFTHDAVNVPADATFVPTLTITYVPEPATLVSLLVGSMGFAAVALRRSRRRTHD